MQVASQGQTPRHTCIAKVSGRVVIEMGEQGAAIFSGEPFSKPLGAIAGDGGGAEQNAFFAKPGRRASTSRSSLARQASYHRAGPTRVHKPLRGAAFSGPIRHRQIPSGAMITTTFASMPEHVGVQHIRIGAIHVVQLVHFFGAEGKIENVQIGGLPRGIA